MSTTVRAGAKSNVHNAKPELAKIGVNTHAFGNPGSWVFVAEIGAKSLTEADLTAPPHVGVHLVARVICKNCFSLLL